MASETIYLAVSAFAPFGNEGIPLGSHFPPAFRSYVMLGQAIYSQRNTLKNVAYTYIKCKMQNAPRGHRGPAVERWEPKAKQTAEQTAWIRIWIWVKCMWASRIVAYINYTPTYINYLLINLSRQAESRKQQTETKHIEKCKLQVGLGLEISINLNFYPTRYRYYSFNWFLVYFKIA